MKIYLAGMEPSYLADVPKDAPILVSYASKSQLRCLGLGETRDVILDSGAFTAWRQGIQIDLIECCQFISDHAGSISAAVALDVIGGSPEQNLQNLDYMEKHVKDGATPIIPVFHEGDDLQLLAEYIRRGYEYIALAGTKNRGKAELLQWVWRVLDCYPPSSKLKYHGLAMTQERMITQLKGALESVDSTTWLALAKYGIRKNQHLLTGRTPAFYRKVGGLLMDDLLQQPAENRVVPLPLFDLKESWG